MCYVCSPHSELPLAIFILVMLGNNELKCFLSLDLSPARNHPLLPLLVRGELHRVRGGCIRQQGLRLVRGGCIRQQGLRLGPSQLVSIPCTVRPRPLFSVHGICHQSRENWVSESVLSWELGGDGKRHTCVCSSVLSAWHAFIYSRHIGVHIGYTTLIAFRGNKLVIICVNQFLYLWLNIVLFYMMLQGSSGLFAGPPSDLSSGSCLFCPRLESLGNELWL